MNPTDDPRTAHLARIRDLGTCQDNRDDLNAENAARNLIADVPAYWHRGRTNAAAYVAENANRAGSMLRAIADWADAHPGTYIASILDKTIPLNAAAVEELEFCYRLQSTHRDDLAGRERRAIFNPVYFPHMNPATRAIWDETYAACQRRFDARQGPAGKPVTSARHAMAVAIASAAGAV